MTDKLSKIGTLVLVGLVLSSLVFLSYQSYGDVRDKANALRGSVSMLENSVRNLIDREGNTPSWIYGGEVYTLQLNGALSKATSLYDFNSSWIEDTIRHIQGCTVQCVSYSTLANELASNLYVKEQKMKETGIEIKGTSFEALSDIISELHSTVIQIERISNELREANDAAKTGGEQEMDALRMKGIELIAYYYQAEAQTNDALAAIPATGVNLLAPFVLITAVFSIFLLLPCMLLLLFFLQKKEKIVDSKMGLLTKLDFEQKEQIQKRAFNFSEYVISIIFLTLINAALLYFFFYPNATSGLAQLISTGGGVRAFADYLSTDATPLTFGFIGAYFYIMQMLLRRYFSSDLTPQVYSYAVVRVLTVFIFSIILQVISTYSAWARFPTAIVAFAIGVFPDVGLRWILRFANSVSKSLHAPEFIDKDPLTKIDGLNTWHEARLLQERIDNVQNLANASLGDLIMNTSFYPQQLFKWVDQAVLYVHTGKFWTESFKSVGITGATELLANAQNGKGVIERDKIKGLVQGINTARSSALAKKNESKKKLTIDKTDSQIPSDDLIMTEEILTTIVTSISEDRAMTTLEKWNNLENNFKK